MSDVERHSKALEIELISDPAQRARQEAENGLRQFDEVIEQINYWLQPERPFKLRISAILSLHRRALEGISSFAGVFRPGGIEIKGSKHEPPGAHLVPELVEQMCDYVNEDWAKSSALHLAAYILWRMNWIHPFVDGNGRTSRVVSYLVLCTKLGYVLPGTRTIPEQISKNKNPYYKALEAADRANAGGNLDLAEMEQLLESLLAAQLVSVIDAARSKR
ncbi:MAG TPA: Fic family protein [Candidatus Acidoferrum sp.]|jgi:Fic family protein